MARAIVAAASPARRKARPETCERDERPRAPRIRMRGRSTHSVPGGQEGTATRNEREFDVREMAVSNLREEGLRLLTGRHGPAAGPERCYVTAGLYVLFENSARIAQALCDPTITLCYVMCVLPDRLPALDRLFM